MIDSFRIPMKAFNHERTIRIYQPPSCSSSSKRYPVLYLHDGQNVFTDESAVGGVSLDLANVLKKNQYEIIIAAIDLNPAGEERINELCPWVSGPYSKKLLGRKSLAGGKGSAYLDFIVRELKPYIDASYRTQPDKSYMAGISLGGSFSLYAASIYPHIFTRVAGLSSAFYRNQEEMEKLLEETDFSSLNRLYLDCGTNEVSEHAAISEEFLHSNQRIFKIMKKKMPEAKFEVIDQGRHHYSDFKERFPLVLEYLLKP
ncbi:alpha/beta hydrolase [Bacillus sp. FJAT-42376]|uniref:alpha/beta hydrolase n=1 Tax=Bacillus sp. FJAT-42376 TaxID=2014076 RepID=UPI000F4DE5B5|nr:alpha/beta hydrolase-fold protein [Bacillus sp. FJAT-42376]AZB43441.1 alpha/beta hydrolase [Bacillus sp. FJAT-42376]